MQTLAQILDPSLTDRQLGASLAKLADLAKGGDYKTALLPVQQDGTLSAQATDSVVKDVLGGTVKSPDAGRGRPRSPIAERHREQGRVAKAAGRDRQRRLTPTCTAARPPPPGARPR